MFDMVIGKGSVPARGGRALFLAGTLAALGGCQVIPGGRVAEPLPPVQQPVETGPQEGVLPTDAERHRVALLVPMSGTNAEVGQSIANAATMALLDTNAQNLRITTYDTATGARSAAARAIADGNRLILGPLLSEDVVSAAAAAGPAKVPMISYSNDVGVADRSIFLLGNVPGQAVARVVSFAKARGHNRFAALIPTGTYGQRAASALLSSAQAVGATVSAVETYDRGNTSIASAVRRLRDKGNYDAVLIADSERFAVQAAPLLKAGGESPQLLGTELWAGDAGIMRSTALRGAWFAAIADGRYGQFQTSYRSRFGEAPHRLATLGYDSVLLALRVARDWRPGTLFPTDKLYDRGGFLGLDGAFRFSAQGIAERAWEVREVGANTVTIASPAPAKFE